LCPGDHYICHGTHEFFLWTVLHASGKCLESIRPYKLTQHGIFAWV
jgi:hypothetical protein